MELSIKNWETGEIIIEQEADSIKKLVEYAVAHKISLAYADLMYADLRYANLRYVDLRGANVDYSAWPLACRSIGALVDDQIAAQLLFHAFAVAGINPTKKQIEFMKAFNHFEECGGSKTLTQKRS
jgi:hypothetical protein